MLWKHGLIIPAVWGLAPDNGGSSVASAKTARRITASFGVSSLGALLIGACRWDCVTFLNPTPKRWTLLGNAAVCYNHAAWSLNV